jgi:hypothetical protein
MLKQHNINYINQIRFIKLLCDDCHKQAVLISESRGDSNQCTSWRAKPDQHTTRFPRPVHVWPSTIRILRGSRIAPFCKVIKRVGQSHCSREKRISDYISNMPADRSVGPHPVSLPLTTIEAMEKAIKLSTTGYYAY